MKSKAKTRKDRSRKPSAAREPPICDSRARDLHDSSSCESRRSFFPYAGGRRHAGNQCGKTLPNARVATRVRASRLATRQISAKNNPRSQFPFSVTPRHRDAGRVFSDLFAGRRPAFEPPTIKFVCRQIARQRREHQSLCDCGIGFAAIRAWSHRAKLESGPVSKPFI